MTFTLLIVSILLVALYVGATIWKRKELPESISAMVYDLSKPWRWVWSVWLATVTVMISPALTEAMPSEWYGIAGHICIVLLAMTAAIPLLPGEHNKAHYVCGISAGIMSQVCVMIICHYWLLTWTLYLILPYCDRRWYVPGLPMWMIRSKVFIVEAFCFVALIGSLLTYKL